MREALILFQRGRPVGQGKATPRNRRRKQGKYIIVNHDGKDGNIHEAEAEAVTVTQFGGACSCLFKCYVSIVSSPKHVSMIRLRRQR